MDRIVRRNELMLMIHDVLYFGTLEDVTWFSYDS